MYHSITDEDGADQKRELWKQALQEILDKPSWIIDGNYFSTQDIRLSSSDTIIVFDYPRTIVGWRVLKNKS